jgi:hypothetical protein
MSSAEDLARLKSGLADIERENADRLSLIDRRAAKSMEESKESGDRLRKETSAVVAGLKERNQRAKAAGGWATESSLADKVEDDGDFGFEEDEEENQRRAGYKTADPLDLPLPTAQRQVPPPPPPIAPVPEPARPAGRHRPRGQHDEEDDYANTDWLDG